MSAEIINCSDCGAVNEAGRSFCVACGAPLWIPEKHGTTAELPANALEIWRKAIAEWKNAVKPGKPDVLAWGHITSLLTLAISYAGSTPFPRAHARLAIALLTLGRNVEAKREADIALQQDPNEFRAQQVKVALALNREKIREELLSRVPPFLCRGRARLGDAGFTNPASMSGPSLKPMTDESNVGVPGPAISSLIAELERLVTIFRNLCDSNANVDEYLNVADFLIMVGDGMREMPLADWRARLYRIVANTPTDKLDCQGRELEVAAVRHKARLGTLLFKLKPAQRIARRRVSSTTDAYQYPELGNLAFGSS